MLELLAAVPGPLRALEAVSLAMVAHDERCLVVGGVESVVVSVTTAA